MESFELSLKSMQNKIFWVWYSLMLFVNLMGSIVAYVLQGVCLLTIICFSLEGIMLIMLIFVIKYEKRQNIGSIVLFLVVSIEFPFLYLVYREIIISYFILGVIAITVFSSRIQRFYLLPTTFAVDIFVIIMADRIGVPNKISDVKIINLFNIFTFIVTGFAAGILAYALIYYYESKKRELNIVNEKLQYVAVHDPLTDLNNRGFIMKYFSSALENQENFYTVLVDIDDFKKVNDTYGHLIGDEVLKTFSVIVKNYLKKNDVAGRYGGEEFLLLFRDDTEEKIRNILDLIQKDFDSDIYQKYNFHVSFSGGIENSKNYTSLNALLLKVDTNLYDAKKHGKKRVI